jgi:DNA-binding XRE family transcriptional regulator
MTTEEINNIIDAEVNKITFNNQEMIKGMLRIKQVLNKTEIKSTSESIGQRIKRLRMSKGLKQSEIAKRIGMSQDTISRYELDKYHATIELIYKIAEALKVDVNELLGEGFNDKTGA